MRLNLRFADSSLHFGFVGSDRTSNGRGDICAGSDASAIMNVEGIRNKIKRLYEAGGDVHVSINTVRPRINVENSPAKIKGVYPNIFRIEEYDDGVPKCHSVQYTDVLIGQVKISELDESAE